MKKGFKYLILALSLFSFQSCLKQLYSPPILNMPLPDSKGEFKGTLYGGTDGMGWQASYSLDSHIVISANASSLQVIRSGFLAPYNTFNISGGYFNHASHGTKYELLGGGGYNIVKYSEHVYYDALPADEKFILNGSYINLYLQGDVSKQVLKTDELAFGLRVSGLLGMTGSYNYSFDTRFSHIDTIAYKIKGGALLVEPCIRFATNWPHFALSTSLGYSFRMVGNDVYGEYGSLYQNFFMSVGVGVKLFKKDTSK
jgi:hypothetical protein